MYTIPELFQIQVEKTPQAVAIAFESRQLTYRELNAKANRLAHHLRSLGVEPKTLVGICVERSMDMVVGLLGILKAGGAYVPLDPTYPQERLAFMLSDTRAPVLLLQSKLAAEFSEYQGRMVFLDTDWEKIAIASQTNPINGARSEDLAYVTYTSGTTGKPKGAMMSHLAICQSWRWLQSAFPFTPKDRVLHKAPLGFDVSSRWELFWPLMAGACVILARPEGEKDTAYQVRLIRQQKITVAYFVSSVLGIFVEEPGLGTRASLRRIFVGGETVPFPLKQRFFQCMSDCDLVEIYGATETIVVSSRLCRPSDPSHRFSITRPIPGLPIHILDKQRKPVPAGEVGELHVGGEFLVRGYLNHSALTAEKFIPNPFDKSRSNRLYATGDLARHLPDGDIELRGRVDHQVKVRGLRIELGEIEEVLNRHPAIKQAIVLVREDIPGDKRLIAYITGYPSQKCEIPIVPELRRFVREKLPAYMVPSTFVVPDKLPLTPNGKIDRQSLPVPDRPARPVLTQAFVASHTPVEAKLAEVWERVLNIRPIGLHDDFFQSGGDSLLAIRLLFEVRHAFGIDLPLRTLLEGESTVAGMVAALDTYRHSKEATSVEGMTVKELLSDAVLEPTIRAVLDPVGSASQPRAILVTGTTGFLGAFLLDQLLQQTKARIHCLVRGCNTPAQGKRKIVNNLKRYLLYPDSSDARIIPVIGDLSKPLLGLHERQFQQLAREIDLIYHAATFLNLAYPYTTLRDTNVRGTREILRLASQIKSKPIHFVSSPAVFKSTGYFNKPSIREEDPIEDCAVVYGGYAQSKWVEEQLLEIARSRGMPINIYRPGSISGHSKTGASNTDQVMERLLKSFVEQGCAPQMDITFDFTPVDYVSQAILYLSRQKSCIGKNFHLINPNFLHIRDLAQLIGSIGYPVEQIEHTQWESKMREVILDSKQNVLDPILPFITANIPGTQQTYLEASSFSPRLDCENAVKGLSGSSIACPPVNSELLSLYLHTAILQK
uniref:Amino acid adenylation domain-containing protein/thioester reductase domain-containing protein n=1 Tax=Candidatus Kentrum sp. MB TaxID=2138164 RepID=A0A450XNS0_9GAMM|nr:MAG: amino acid adenylation domain-containing protein/thioester reductase domain-containing protein [Candidatus Kentron sp. MB]